MQKNGTAEIFMTSVNFHQVILPRKKYLMLKFKSISFTMHLQSKWCEILLGWWRVCELSCTLWTQIKASEPKGGGARSWLGFLYFANYSSCNLVKNLDYGHVMYDPLLTFYSRDL